MTAVNAFVANLERVVATAISSMVKVGGPVVGCGRSHRAESKGSDSGNLHREKGRERCYGSGNVLLWPGTRKISKDLSPFIL